jgi:hypothetical protein
VNRFHHFARAGVSGPGGAARVRLTSTSPTIAAQNATRKPSMMDSTLASARAGELRDCSLDGHQDGLIARLVCFNAGDDDRAQPYRFALVLIRPSDGHVHDRVAGTVEQRHHVEAFSQA